MPLPVSQKIDVTYLDISSVVRTDTVIEFCRAFYGINVLLDQQRGWS